MPRAFKAANKPVHGTSVILAPSALRSTNTSGPTVNTTKLNSLRLDLGVTTHTGTNPTLDVAVQTSTDGSTWVTVGSFTQVTTADTSTHKLFGPLDNYTKASWTIGGTAGPAYTFSVTGVGV